MQYNMTIAGTPPQTATDLIPWTTLYTLFPKTVEAPSTNVCTIIDGTTTTTYKMGEGEVKTTWTISAQIPGAVYN